MAPTDEAGNSVDTIGSMATKAVFSTETERRSELELVQHIEQHERDFCGRHFCDRVSRSSAADNVFNSIKSIYVRILVRSQLSLLPLLLFFQSLDF